MKVRLDDDDDVDDEEDDDRAELAGGREATEQRLGRKHRRANERRINASARLLVLSKDKGRQVAAGWRRRGERQRGDKAEEE